MKILYQESKQCQNFIKWKITILNGKIHYNWPFSIAMLNYQRVPDHRPHPIPYRTCCSANETPSETPTAQRNLAEESKLSPPSARAPWSRYMWKIPWNLGYVIWLYICHITLLVEHENRWDLWMFIPQEIHWSTAKKGWTLEFFDDFTAVPAVRQGQMCPRGNEATCFSMVRYSIVNSRCHKRHSVTLFRGGNRRFDRGTFGDTCFVQSRGELLR